MGAHGAGIPSRIHSLTTYAENFEQIAEEVTIYPGCYSYNGDTTRNYLPGIRGQGAYMGGAPAYPTFANEFGDIFVLQKRFEGSERKLPRVSVGTAATLEGFTVVNIPVGRSYPKSIYEQRVVNERETPQEAIGVAVFDFINGNDSEVSTSFMALLVQRAIRIRRAREHYQETRGYKAPKSLIHRG